jgi:hypothetical protein
VNPENYSQYYNGQPGCPTLHVFLLIEPIRATWSWLEGLTGGAPTFIGSLTGASIGLIALVIGALFNAHLNRRRDDRLRNDDARAVLASIKAELSRIKATLLSNVDTLDEQRGDILVPDIAHSVRIMPHLLPKLGLLDEELIGSVIDAYVSIDQYYEALIVHGGNVTTTGHADRRLIAVPKDGVARIAKINQNLVEVIQEALGRLEAAQSIERGQGR